MSNYKILGVLATAAIMATATIAGAANASVISDEIIQSGTFTPVIGFTAKSADMIGAVDVSSALANVAGGTAATGSVTITSSGVTISGEKAILASGSDHVYLNDQLGDGGVTQVTKDNLPTILADGKITTTASKEYKYTQKVTIGEASYATFKFDDSSGTLADPALVIDLGTATATPVYNFVVDFSEATNLTGTNSKGQEITLFGNKYTVGSLSSTTEVQLLGGSSSFTVKIGEEVTQTLGEKVYKIKLNGVTAAGKATVTVTDAAGNSATDSITEGNTKTIQGTSVYVKTANNYGFETNQGDATIMLGADELWLKDATELKTGSSKKTVDGTLVSLTGTNTEALTKITIAVTAKNSDLDHLAIGDSFTDPIFKTVKLTFADATNAPITSSNGKDSNTDRKAVEVLIADSNALTVQMTDNKGRTASLPFAYDATTTAGTTAVLADRNAGVIATVEGVDIDTDESYVLLNSNNEYVAIGKVKTVNNANCSLVDLTIQDVFDTSSNIVEWEDQDVSSAKTFTYGGKTFSITCSAGSYLKIVDGTTTITAVFPFVELYSGYNQKVAFTEDKTDAITEFAGLDSTTAGANGTIVQLPTGKLYLDVYKTAANNDTIAYSTDVWTTSTVINATATSVLVGKVYYYVAGTLADGTFDIAVNAYQNGTASKQEQPGLLIVEEKDATNSDAYEAVIINTDDTGGNDYRLQALAPVFTDTHKLSKIYDNTDLTGYIDAFGTYVLYNTNGDQDRVTITIPKTQMYANVYLAATGATTSAGSDVTYKVGDTISGVGIVKASGGSAPKAAITASIAKLDTEVTLASGGYVVVGGPAVNKIAAQLLGVAEGTTGLASGVPQNGYIIKLFETTSYDALLIAGWEAANTREATTKVVSEIVGPATLTKVNLTAGHTVSPVVVSGTTTGTGLDVAPAHE